MFTRFLHACAAAAITAAMGCSASPNADSDLDVSSEALRALGANEIIGELRYGQTSAAVAYTESPKYRAFRFQGTAGDAVDAWVRGPSGDARGWLLNSSFQNVVSNDNASASTRDSHLVAKLTRTGAYYIAFREATGEDASFTVSLEGNAPACNPEEENCGGGGTPSGIFDVNPCTGGAPLTKAIVTRYFSPAALLSDEVTQAPFYSRKRRCNTVSGCAAWENDVAPLVWTNDSKALTSGRFNAQVLASGEVNLLFSGNDGAARAPFTCTLEGACSLGPGYLKNAFGIQTDRFPASFTTSCVYLKLVGSVATGQPSERIESEVVLSGTVQRPTH